MSRKLNQSAAGLQHNGLGTQQFELRNPFEYRLITLALERNPLIYRIFTSALVRNPLIARVCTTLHRNKKKFPEGIAAWPALLRSTSSFLSFLPGAPAQPEKSFPPPALLVRSRALILRNGPAGAGRQELNHEKRRQEQFSKTAQRHVARPRGQG
jgi:hypothetical protein